MTREEGAARLLQNPAQLGWALGYKNFVPAIHGRWITRMVTGTEDMTLQAHRGSYKTTCLCVAIALLLIRQRDSNIIFLRKTDADVAEVVTNVSRILQEPVFQELYTVLTGGLQLSLTKATSTEITTSAYTAPRGSAQLQGIGIGGSLTGKHADIIITDDIVNFRDRISPAERNRTKAIYQELQNIRNPGGRIINTGTPWHPDDAFTLMPAAEKWDCYQTGMLTEAQLAELRQSMSPSLFAANYELQHIAAEEALFKTPPVFATDEMAVQILGWRDAKAVDLIRDGIAHIDASYGGEDFTAFTCGRRIGDTLILYGRMWHAHVDTILDAALADAERLMCGPVWTETNGDKGFLAKEIVRRGYGARKYAEKENKYLKISSYLRKWWPNILWIQGTDREYLNQILTYTEDAEHDDAPDSAAVVCRCFDKRGSGEYTSLFTGQAI